MMKAVLAGIGLISAVIAIWQFILEPLEEKKYFDETVENIFNSSEFQSSTGYLNDVIPNNFFSTREEEHWKAFSYSWNKHSERVEQSYEPLAEGLRSATMRAGSTKDQVCSHVKSIVINHYNNINELSKIRGVNISYVNGTESSIFGPVVVIPKINNLELILDEACNYSQQDINIELARLEQQLSENSVENIAEKIKVLNEKKNINYDSLLKEQYDLFIQTYYRHLVSEHMDESEAKDDALNELRNLLKGDGMAHWTVPRMNAISDRIQQLLDDSQRDYDAEIDLLKEQQKTELTMPPE